MKNLTIDALIADFEKSAGVVEPPKAEATDKPSVSAELEALLNKQASVTEVSGAEQEGRSIARQILADLQKQAAAGDANTENGVAPDSAPNKIQQDNAEVVAQDDTKEAPTVTSPEDTITDTFHDSLMRAIQGGAETYDQADALADETNNANAGETKQAEEKMNEQLIDKIASLVVEKLTKAAGEGDMNTMNGVANASAPNKIQQDNAEMVAQDDAKVQPLPAEGGTMNQILDAIVNTAIAQGAQPSDRSAVGSHVASTDAGTPASEEVEKAAAVSALVESGVNFYDAVDLVKAAEYELLEEAFEQEKVAAAQSLVEAGMDVEAAVNLVKSAASMEGLKGIYEGAKGALSHVGKSIASDAGKVGGQLRNVGAAMKANGGMMNNGTLSTIRALAKNRAIQAGTVAAAGTAGLASSMMRNRDQEKKAAFDTLTEAGIDYVTAASLVEETARNLYGE